MSQAESLLNSLSATKGMTLTSPINDVLVIDGEKRTISIPNTEILFGVEDDVDAERKHFLCPRYVGDNIDLLSLKLQMHYENTLKEKGVYEVTDVAESDNGITFSWLLGGDLFKTKGTIRFSVRAISDADVCVWNTTFATGTVLEGLNADEETL